jgi:hypothetical protein
MIRLRQNLLAMSVDFFMAAALFDTVCPSVLCPLEGSSLAACGVHHVQHPWVVIMAF